MTAHVDEIFSRAFDDELRGAERERFDDHLASCTACHEAYDHFRASVSALRTLPHAVMPVNVHLPAAPPVALTWWQRLADLSTEFKVVVATVFFLALAALAGINLSHGTQTASRLGGNAMPVTMLTPGVHRGAAVPQPMTTPGALTSSLAPACTPQSVSQASASAPTGFANVVTQNDASRPGTQIVLATPDVKVSAGSQLLVYSRLTNGGSIGAIPCVALQDVPTYGSSSVAPGAPNNAAAGAASQSRVFDMATPTQDVSVSGTPLQTVTIPAGLQSGTTLELTATVPSGYPAGSGGVVTVVLYVQVS